MMHQFSVGLKAGDVDVNDPISADPATVDRLALISGRDSVEDHGSGGGAARRRRRGGRPDPVPGHRHGVLGQHGAHRVHRRPVLLTRLHGDGSGGRGRRHRHLPQPAGRRPHDQTGGGRRRPEVAIKDAELFVDEHRVDEPYVDHASIDGVYFGPVTVPAGSVFVMGDHRETSIDSRSYGPIRAADIDGRLLLRVGPQCGG